jgi:hypothetical protein
MATADVIRVSLTSPMDWAKFEDLAYEILIQDDLPSLRKIGGTGDLGRDAIEESFWGSTVKTNVVVQITSEQTQISKFKRTVKRLRECNIAFEHLIMVYRQPVSSDTRTAISSSALQEKISVDIRDQSYLIAQLGKPGSKLFYRYFSDIKTQVEQLLGSDDPLDVSDTRLSHAMLASIGAYVINPRARIARQTLFQKTVLAAIVSAESPINIDSLKALVSNLMPEEAVDNDRVQAAVRALSENGECYVKNNLISPTEKTLHAVALVLSNSKAVFVEIVKCVLDKCHEAHKINDATKGFIERNIKKTILFLFRKYGPLFAAKVDGGNGDINNADFLTTLSADIKQEVANTAALALGAFIENPDNCEKLSIFSRTYSSLAIRNLDPAGRRWQQSALSRKIIVLDTDAVLKLMISDLPEHKVLLGAVRSLEKAGIEIVVSGHVLEEVVGHIGRAQKTFDRFKNTLFRMSPVMVDANVWHAVVRGYYYSIKGGNDYKWADYWSGYFDTKDPLKFVEFVLARRIKYRTDDFQNVEEDDHFDVEQIVEYLLKYKEQQRLKAAFREDEQMQTRLSRDIKMAVNIAGKKESKGYLASEDNAFAKAEKHECWGEREKILIFTSALPEFTEFVCGDIFDDDQIVRLLFDPVLTAAAQLICDEIDVLTSVGVDLHKTPLDRLDWNVNRDVFENVQKFLNIDPEKEDVSQAALDLSSSALNAGFSLDPRVQKVIEEFDITHSMAESEREKRLELEEKIKKVFESAAGFSRKGRRRANKIIKELGLDVELGQLEDDDLESSE